MHALRGGDSHEGVGARGRVHLCIQERREEAKVRGHGTQDGDGVAWDQDPCRP